MVSFTSISNGVKLCLLVSSFVYTTSAAPATASKTVSTSTTSFILPPIISGRAKIPKPDSTPDMNIENEIISKNNAWAKAHNVTTSTASKKSKRDDSTVSGLYLDLPSTYPSIETTSGASITSPTTAQINVFEKYASLAATAYCRAVVPSDTWTCTQCLSSVPDGVLITTFSSLIDDTNGFILRSDKDKTIYLVFRGTNSFRSAIVDLEFVLTDYPNVAGAQVHTGFLGSYNSVISDYFPVLQSQLTSYPSYKVVVTGHSLGGAQALLAGMDLYTRESRLGPSNLSIYTYGCPRVGNPDFAYFVDGTGILFSRTVHERDIVPHLPPMSFGFLHPGIESWIVSDPATIQICTSDIEDADCADSIVPFTSISDHLTYFNINEGSCL